MGDECFLWQRGGRRWQVAVDAPIELAVALDFEGHQANAFGLEDARREAVEAGDFVGDRRRGGSVNCERLTMIPHANGTHTEGVGHISKERVWVADMAPAPLYLAALLTVRCERLGDIGESYGGKSEDSDWVVSARGLASVMEDMDPSPAIDAVILRVEAPSFEAGGRYGDQNPPYLSDEAVGWLRRRGIEHLLVELPSVDRGDDGGALASHHAFFGHRRGEAVREASRGRTITEMIAVPDAVEDGLYGLSLRFGRIQSDAAASRPVIYGVRQVG